MRFNVVNLGCKVNRVESDQIAAVLRQAHTESSADSADIVIVNTCTVTGEADKKTRKAIRHILRNNADGDVIVTGCASQIAPDMFRALSERVRVVPKSEIMEYAAQLAEHADAQSAMVARCGVGFNTRVGVKVQDGCDNACTYCIVHVARGNAESMPHDQVVDECAAFAGRGVKELVLTGINLGSYRRVAHGGREYLLHDLLSDLLEATARSADGAPCRFRLSSIEPNDLSPETIGLIAASDGRICRHLHLPLQSGSSKVLHEMARRYSAEDYAGLVARLRSAIPQISLTTDVIVGFPGETEEDFRATMQLARSCGFSKIHVFPYSKREGTPAAARSDQVSDAVKSARAAALRQLSDELRRADYHARVGRRERAVVEQRGRCMTESYYEIACTRDFPAGSLVEVVIPPDTCACE